MNKNKSTFILLAMVIMLVYTSCGKKNTTETTETSNEEQTTTTNDQIEGSSSSQSDQVQEITVSAFDFSNIAESNANIGSFPYLKDIPGFKDIVYSEDKDAEFDRVVFFDGKGFSSIEGHLLFKNKSTENENSFSSYKVIKQFEKNCEDLGAVKVYSLTDEEITPLLYGGNPDLMSRFPKKDEKYLVRNGSKETALYALKKGDKKALLYMTLDGNYGGNYKLYVVEEGTLN